MTKEQRDRIIAYQLLGYITKENKRKAAMFLSILIDDQIDSNAGDIAQCAGNYMVAEPLARELGLDADALIQDFMDKYGESLPKDGRYE